MSNTLCTLLSLLLRVGAYHVKSRPLESKCIDLAASGITLLIGNHSEIASD